ncbi:MAG: hypothetical protein ACSLFI_00185 [Solirubrobacterales bacterium]
MIDIPTLNSQFVAQDDALRQTLAKLVAAMTEETSARALVAVVAEGLAAIHERQGNLITLMLRTNQ